MSCAMRRSDDMHLRGSQPGIRLRDRALPARQMAARRQRDRVSETRLSKTAPVINITKDPYQTPHEPANLDAWHFALSNRSEGSHFAGSARGRGIEEKF